MTSEKDIREAGLKAGDEVAIEGGGFHSHMCIGTVKKVTAAGNFIVSYGADLTTCFRGADGAERTSDIWHKKAIRPLTDQLRSQIREQESRRRMIRALSSAKWSAFDTVKLGRIYAILQEDVKP